MKSRRKKVILAVLGILLIALILNAIFTWGIIFGQTGGFMWSRTYIFEDIIADNQASQIVLGDSPNNPIFFIPLVFYIYGIEPPPYVIDLEISDETEKLENIFIKSISIEYINGKKIHQNINWERKFKSSFVLRSINSKNIDVPVKYLSDKLPVTVDRRQSCNIRFVGYFVGKEGDKIPFDTTKYFEYETPHWRVYPARGSF